MIVVRGGGRHSHPACGMLGEVVEGSLMTDAEAIQGYWRLLSHVRRGSRAMTSVTHLLFEQDCMKEIDPDLVDDGSVRSTYQLDPTTSPKRIVDTTAWFDQQDLGIARFLRARRGFAAAVLGADRRVPQGVLGPDG